MFSTFFYRFNFYTNSFKCKIMFCLRKKYRWTSTKSSENFYRFKKKLFLFLGRLDTRRGKFDRVFFLPEYLAARNRLGNKTPWDGDGSPRDAKKCKWSISIRGRHSTQFPRPTRRLPPAARRGTVPMAKEERQLLCRDFRPGSAWDSLKP